MMHAGFGWVGFLFMLLFWAVLIALAVGLMGMVFHRRGPRAPADGRPTPRQILDVRYARGEIDHEQYELMKKDLS